jgi:hypothetical protein
MKKAVISLLYVCVLTNIVKAQQKDLSYKEKSGNAFIVGNVGLAASLLCLGGVAVTPFPRFDHTKSNDASYVKQYDADYNSYLQTRRELIVLGGIGAVVAVSSYTVAAIYLKRSSSNQLKANVGIGNVWLCYRF